MYRGFDVGFLRFVGDDGFNVNVVPTYVPGHEDAVSSSAAAKEESKVFVWNNFAVEEKEECDEYVDDESRSKSPASETSLVGYEIAPGIGSVILNTNEDNADHFKLANLSVDMSSSDVTTKKVMRAFPRYCPSLPP